MKKYHWSSFAIKTVIGPISNQQLPTELPMSLVVLENKIPAAKLTAGILDS